LLLLLLLLFAFCVRVQGNWVEDVAGFGLYANGIGPGDRRYSSAKAADVNRGAEKNASVCAIL
jgi:hypothetical protein